MEQSTNIISLETLIQWELAQNGTIQAVGKLGAVTKDETMIAAIATIAFLATAWAAIVILAGTLEFNLGKIGAALRGDVGQIPAPIAVRVSQRYPTTRVKRVRARPAMRAAA